MGISNSDGAGMFAILALVAFISNNTNTTHTNYPQEKSRLIMTIDDGPNYYTIPIAKKLIENKVNAIWFITGINLDIRRNQIVFLLTNNFTIGNHTTSHNIDYFKNNYWAAYQDVSKVNNYIKKEFNYQIKFFRPPYGLLYNTLFMVVRKLGLHPVPWTIDFKEDEPITKKVINNVMTSYTHAFNSKIILLHSNEWGYKNIDFIIKEMKNYGEFVDNLENSTKDVIEPDSLY